MTSLKRRVLLLAAAAAMNGAATLAAHADPLATPVIAGPLSANPNPFSVDTSDWLGDAGGKIYVGGVLTGLAYVQSNATHFLLGDADSFGDLSNGQIFVQKTDGWLQFYVQAGAYSFPTVGAPYQDSSFNTHATFGYVPVAYAKLVGGGSLSNFSIEGGKLPTLIGDEYAFTFQNMNIERGQLWYNEPIISRGVQVNYANGPLTVSLSLNDGNYSDVWNSLSGLISYGFNGGADTLAFAASGNLGSPTAKFGLLNTGSVYDLIYTHVSGPWTISPYFQINSTPTIGLSKGSTAYGGALLTSYSFNDNWKLAARAEYESESNGLDLFGYGSGSDAFTITVTPTYQWKIFYARVEGSYVTVGGGGSGFGPSGSQTDQFRGLVEAGILF